MVIRAIATNVFKEAIRDRILYSLLVFTIILISASILIGRLTMGQDQRVVKDLGLASMSLFGVIIATFIGTTLFHKEIQKRTIYTILTKPIHRFEFILGKYFGLLLTAFVCLAIMAAALFAVLILNRIMIGDSLVDSGGPIAFSSMLKAIVLVFLEIMIVTALAVLFSTVTNSTLSFFFTLAVYVIGHLTVDLKEIGAISKSTYLKGLCSILYYILPNLENFNIRAEMVRGLEVSNKFIIYTNGYAVLYIAAILLISILSMERKEFV